MYQVLARKYRPRNFNELVGQSHVSRALTSALDRGRLHHAYLFTGTRGVGKTTIARILAKCLNCETGVTSTPCEVCPTCTAVNEGRFIDLIEIDAASRTKVEDTRELLDNVPYAPTQGRYKVYLIDEVHMLSTHSFNALLKTLEEPPEHVKFLFATTDPQKLPITVISRCLQFTLRPLAVDEITQHLTQVLSQEDIQAESDAIWQIAESAQGSLRDAMSLTDQAIAYGQGSIQHTDVKEMLGLIDRTIIYDLILAIHQNQKARVSALLMQFRHQALDVSLVLDQLISTLHELALLQYLPDLALKYSDEINAKIMQLSAQISAIDLQLYYQIACKGRAELQLAVTQEQGFEMCVLRLLAFRPLQPHEAQSSQQTITVAEPVPVHVPQPELAAPVLENHVEPVVSEHSSAVIDDFDLDAAYDDDEPLATSVVDEISSDDYLDEDVAESLPSIDSTVAIEQPVQAADLAVETNPNQVIFDPTQADGLLGFDHDSDPHDEPEPDQAEISALIDALAPVSNSSNETKETIQVEVEQSAPRHLEALPEFKPASDQQAMPQDILRLSEQVMEGEWDLDKWEYYFRKSDLSPAIQELAQHGMMTGQINGTSVLHIPTQYEQILTSLLPILEGDLKQHWPKTQLQIRYQEVNETTPAVLQQQRRARAQQRAVELLEQEPVVKSLLDTFEAQLQNVQLK